MSVEAKKHKILIIDDAVDMQLILEFDLSKAGCEVYKASSGEEGIEFFETQTVDLILLDLIMPGKSGLETLETLKSLQVSKSIPVIMLSSSIDEDSIVKALDLGADDYVIKPYISRVLLARIRTSLRAKENSLKLEKMAKTDYLTGINNKGNFINLASKILSYTKRTKGESVVAMLDLDLFKSINDKYGHHVGDLCIVAFTKCLKKSLRDYDIIGRVGGEEFAVCLPGATMSDAYQTFERFRRIVESLSIATHTNEQFVSLTVSIGLSSTEKGDFEVTELLKKADKGLYYAKQNGRNQVCNGDDIPQGIENKENTQKIGKLETATASLAIFHTRVLPGINFSVGLDNVLGTESLYKEMLLLFYTNHFQDAYEIELALLEQNILTIRSLSHRLKEVANSIGAMKLYKICQEFDIAINHEPMIDVSMTFENLKAELNTVLTGIQENLDVS
ncbi:MAG: diguanylate cyclase [Colwellia sp.]